MPNDQVLRWAARATGGTSVVSVESLSRSGHRNSGTFRLRIEGTLVGTTDVILKVSVPRRITGAMVNTNARALQLAEPTACPRRGSSLLMSTAAPAERLPRWRRS
jgi:hypothetical protein